MVYISYGTILVGIISMLLGVILSHKKGESEISTSISEHITFKVGAVLAVVGIILRIIMLFI